MECTSHQILVTNDALDLLKLDYGKMNLVIVSMELGDVIQSAIDIYKNGANSRCIDLNLKESAPIYIKGDPVRITQILLNLISNSLKFTETGHVTLRYKQDISGVVIEVEDSGIGMSIDQLKKLFERQPHVTKSSCYGGSGLGLYISKKLAILMGGDITVTSALEKGSLFTVKFYPPALSPDEITSFNVTRNQKAEIISKSVESSRKFILVVEDNVINQRILVAILKKLGYDSIVAVNGEDGIKKYMMHSVELCGIFMDIEMPVMNGCDSTKEIRIKEKEMNLPAIPIIGVSGNALELWKDLAVAAGMNDYITKPITQLRISQKIEEFFKITERREEPSIISK